MGSTTLRPDWTAELDRWLAPFLARLGRQEQRRWAPVYLRGLIGPGERKSIAPMAARVAPGEVQQLHHFLSTAPWATAPLEAELVAEADRLVGGPDAVLVVDDTALVKKGRHSVGVAHQYCGQLGKQANCQVLVSLTLARAEVPVCLALRLFLPEAWAGDDDRRRRAGVSDATPFRPKWRIALDELDRLIAAGARFGCVLADAEYGKAAPFRHGLSERGLTWAAGILPTQKVYPTDVTLAPAHSTATGRPRKHPVPSVASRDVAADIAARGDAAFQTITWRRGTKGDLAADFAAVRVRVADGPVAARAQHLPGPEAWLVCERRANGERKFSLSNAPADTPLAVLAAQVKARWVCEQAHQQLKEELGLDHLECRSWQALHHHALLTLLAFCFLQHLRLREKKSRAGRRRPAAPADAAGGPPTPRRGAHPNRAPLSPLPAPHRVPPPTVNVAE